MVGVSGTYTADVRASRSRGPRAQAGRVFEKLPGLLEEQAGDEHVSGAGGEEIGDIEAGASPDERGNAGVLEHPLHEQRGGLVWGRADF